MIRSNNRSRSFLLCFQHESFQLNKEILDFVWTVFEAIPSLKEGKINWLNYKTGNKNVIFKMDADNASESVEIKIARAVVDLQQDLNQSFV